MRTENLKETYKDLDSQVKALRESLKGWRKNDEMRQGIAAQNRILESSFGAEQAVKLSHRMLESDEDFHLVREACYDAQESGILKETNAVTAFGALLRLGVQNIIAKAYNLVPLVWDKVAMTVPSSAFIQPYGSTFRAQLPHEVAAGDEFPDSNVSSYGALVENVKFGRVLSYQKEALDDDQTGELVSKASELGENMAIYQELAFAATICDMALTEGDLTYTPDTYTDPDGTTGVYKTAAVDALRANRVASMGAPSLALLRELRYLLKNMHQPDGQKVLINPNCIVYHHLNEQELTVLLDSPNYPGSVSAASTPGATGGTMAVNPLKGLYTRYECRYLNAAGSNPAWFMGQANTRSIIWQERDGLQVLQESPDAGKSFDRDLVRWRTRKRGRMFFFPGGARFWGQGSDGN